MRRAAWCGVLTSILPLAGACNPATTVAKIGLHAVGKVVSDEETRKLAQELAGQPPSAADARLGNRVDAFREVNGAREWMTYPVKMDPLHLKRYIVEVVNNRITGVEQVDASTSEVDIARKLVYETKVKGKTPGQCQQALGMGSPMLAARSVGTGQLVHIYDGQMIEGLGDQKYCVLRFGGDGLCEKLDLVDVMATAN